MNTIIDNLKNASTPIQALGITAGGLIGVFATLGFFYILIILANKTTER